MLLVMITNKNENWHNITVIKKSRLFSGMTASHDDIKTVFHSFITIKKSNSFQDVFENPETCKKSLPSNEKKTLKYNHGGKYINHSFIIYLDFACLIENENDLSSKTVKTSKNIPTRFSVLTHCLFGTNYNKISYHRSEDCIKKSFERFGKKGLVGINLMN